MAMLLISRLLYTLAALLMPVRAHLANYHVARIVNRRWPSHAKFHTGQTLMMSSLLGVMTLFFAWRGSTDRLTSVWAASGFASLYRVTQALAIVYPGTSVIDAKYTTPGSHIASQYSIAAVFLRLVGITTRTGMRRRHSSMRFQGSKH